MNDTIQIVTNFYLGNILYITVGGARQCGGQLSHRGNGKVANPKHQCGNVCVICAVKVYYV